MLTQLPRVGDTVTFKATVLSVNEAYSDKPIMKVQYFDCQVPAQTTVFVGRACEIIERALQVGDTVWYENASRDGGTLLYIHQGEGDERKFAVVAYKGNSPKSVPFDQIRRTRECAV